MRHLLYTEEEGGEFKYVTRRSDEEIQELFDTAVKKKQLIFQTGDKIIRIRPVYMCIVEEISNFDFVLGDARK